MMLSKEEIDQVDWSVFSEEDMETLMDLQFIPKQEIEDGNIPLALGFL